MCKLFSEMSSCFVGRKLDELLERVFSERIKKLAYSYRKESVAIYPTGSQRQHCLNKGLKMCVVTEFFQHIQT